jgi:hypothetical protein
MQLKQKYLIVTLVWTGLYGHMQAQVEPEIPSALKTVLENTYPLEHPRLERLPLYLWPIHNTLQHVSDFQSRQILADLEKRGIAYCVNWNHQDFEKSVAEGLRIARMQRSLGLRVNVNANACLHALFDGTSTTAHIDSDGRAFWDTSFGPKTGCPFALEHRIPVIQNRIHRFVDAYQRAGLQVDFIFADWEIDGPMEWNGAWSQSKRCDRCQQNLPANTDFRTFQTILRKLRSNMQQRMFSQPVLNHFPNALVGNYAVAPHDGYRYWYDYFEKLPEEAPFITEHQTKHREWVEEFESSAYTLAMPVVYTWHDIFKSLPFEETDYRWFYHMLKVASNASAHTPSHIPSVPFVHWHTTAPPDPPSNPLIPFSETGYQALLWHLLLRGHDTFFLWCLQEELSKEVHLVHKVYRASMEFSDYILNGIPVEQHVPGDVGTVISGLRLKNKVLVKCNHFRPESRILRFWVSETEWIDIPSDFDLGILPVSSGTKEPDWSDTTFPIGFYEYPADPDTLLDMAQAGVNLVRCGNLEQLDRVGDLGMRAWVSMSVQDGLTDELRQRAATLWNHPALAIWEGPDEIVWTFTAYSFLKERAGFTREDWNNQLPIAVNYAASVGNDLMARMRTSIQWLKRNDPKGRPFWINEAADSDASYARGYVDDIDIIGCDYYAVRAAGTDLQSTGRLVERWDAIGKGRPVWMVLQGFSWHTIHQDRKRLYPSFAQSRFMAYDAIVHGARGLLYWGTETIDDADFRQSLYALTSEIAAIATFLHKDNITPLAAHVIPDLFEAKGNGVKAIQCHRDGHSVLIVLNKDSHRHLAVEVKGLELLNGRRLHLLYGNEVQRPEDGTIITRIQGDTVKVFTTDPSLATGIQKGRDFVDLKAILVE